VREAKRERLVAYIFLLVFVAVLLWFGGSFAELVQLTMDTSFPAAPLIAGAVVLSLLMVVPLTVTFRTSAASNLLQKMREKAKRSGKHVTLQTAGRMASLYTVALAATPMFYGMALVFLIGDFTAMLLLLPATAILAIVGWVVVGRLLEEMRSMFLQ
jgi:hypothetical protein